MLDADARNSGGRKSGGDESLIVILHEIRRIQDRSEVPGSYRRVGEVTMVSSKFAVETWSNVGAHGRDELSSLVHRGNRLRSSRDRPTPRFPDFPVSWSATGAGERVPERWRRTVARGACRAGAQLLQGQPVLRAVRVFRGNIVKNGCPIPFGSEPARAHARAYQACARMPKGRIDGGNLQPGYRRPGASRRPGPGPAPVADTRSDYRCSCGNHWHDRSPL